MTDVHAALAKLRAPVPANLISKLPKPTKAQTEAVRNNYKAGIRCELCGAWHHPDVIHLDYVGHAALTAILLDVDPEWYWEPVAFDKDGLPALDSSGGLWIRLFVCGISRLGYGHADPKPNQDAGARIKEAIGDALRNAGMRFGIALDLWHKGDLHASDDNGAGNGEGGQSQDGAVSPPQAERVMPDDEYNRLLAKMKTAGVAARKLHEAFGVTDLRMLDQGQYATAMKRLDKTIADKAKEQTNEQAKELLDDEIPY